MKRKKQTQQDGGGGIILIALAAFAYWAMSTNSQMTDSQAQARVKQEVETAALLESMQQIHDAEPPAKPVVLSIDTDACQIDKHLVAAIILQESGGDPNAIGDGGRAKGAMQLHEAAAKEHGVINRLDPRENVRGATEYVTSLCHQFGNVKRALWAYNWGQGYLRSAIRAKPGAPAIPESTRRYADKIIRTAAMNRNLYQLAGDL